MPRKHVILGNISKQQQANSKVTAKLAKEIKAAAKVGGTNPEGNPRLKAAIDKALAGGLTKDSIEKNIHGADKDASKMETMEFECYGPEGVQLIVTALTDNGGRTIAALNGYLSKLHGQIAKANSVKVFFDNKGYIVAEGKDVSKDAIEEFMLNNDLEGYLDSNELDGAIEIFTEPNDTFYAIRDALKANGYNILESEIKLIPQNPVSNISADARGRIEKFIELCNDDDDINNVITNYQPEE